MNAIRRHAFHGNKQCGVGLIFLVTASIALHAQPMRGQNLVTNGSFESPIVVGDFNTYLGVDAVSLTGWVVDQAGTSIDHDGGLWQDADGAQSIDMNGTEAGTIYQDLATTGGQQYKIRFALAGNPFGYDDKRLEVLWDGAQIADVTFVQAPELGTPNMGWTYHEFSATAGDNSTRLTIHSLTGPIPSLVGVQSWYGPALDDVSVVRIPEPASLALICFGWATLFGCRRKSRG